MVKDSEGLHRDVSYRGSRSSLVVEGTIDRLERRLLNLKRTVQQSVFYRRQVKCIRAGRSLRSLALRYLRFKTRLQSNRGCSGRHSNSRRRPGLRVLALKEGLQRRLYRRFKVAVFLSYLLFRSSYVRVRYGRCKGRRRRMWGIQVYGAGRGPFVFAMCFLAVCFSVVSQPTATEATKSPGSYALPTFCYVPTH